MSDKRKDKVCETSGAPAMVTVEKNNCKEYLSTEEEDADECAWAKQFKKSDDFLKHLALEARDERRQKMTVPLETIFDD